MSSKKWGILVVSDLHQRTDAVPRHARHVVDDRDPTTREPVKQRRLTDVWPSDDDNLG